MVIPLCVEWISQGYSFWRALVAAGTQLISNAKRGKLRPREEEEETELLSGEAGGRFSVQAAGRPVFAGTGPQGAFTEELVEVPSPAPGAPAASLPGACSRENTGWVTAP